jgi:hypothetical protein
VTRGRLCIGLASALQLVAAVTKHIFSAAILAVLVSVAGACAQVDGTDVVADDGTDVEWPPTAKDKERIWVDGRTIVEGGVELPGEVGAGACACTTAECFDAWVVDAFGCDVCVAFVCDEETVAHSCAPCDENPLNRGETWDGDGERL